MLIQKISEKSFCCQQRSSALLIALTTLFFATELFSAAFKQDQHPLAAMRKKVRKHYEQDIYGPSLTMIQAIGDGDYLQVEALYRKHFEYFNSDVVLGATIEDLASLAYEQVRVFLNKKFEEYSKIGNKMGESFFDYVNRPEWKWEFHWREKIFDFFDVKIKKGQAMRRGERLSRQIDPVGFFFGKRLH